MVFRMLFPQKALPGCHPGSGAGTVRGQCQGGRHWATIRLAILDPFWTHFFIVFSTAGLNLAQVWGVPSVEVTKVLWLAEQAHDQTEEKTRL